MMIVKADLNILKSDITQLKADIKTINTKLDEILAILNGGA